MSVPVEKNVLYDSRESERGAALIAVVAILALVSVFLTIGSRFLPIENDNNRRVDAQKHMEFVIDQIATYVHRENRLPCPANPALGPYGANANFGTEDRPAVNAQCNASVGGQFLGIVPFQTLNIDESYARDAWGNYLTYAISPIFSNTRSNQGDAQTFYTCRKIGAGEWVDDSNPLDLFPAPTPTAGNLRKARFCCPRPVPAGGPTFHNPNNDLVILNEAGLQTNLRPDQGAAPAVGTPFRDTQAVEPGAWGNIDTGAPINFPNTNYIDNVNNVTFAIVLVSHGPNAGGAFLANGTTNRFPHNAAFSDEDENADLDNRYVDRPMVIVENSNNYFDDIVLWRTQFSLYNELNNASCARPWR